MYSHGQTFHPLVTGSNARLFWVLMVQCSYFESLTFTRTNTPGSPKSNSQTGTTEANKIRVELQSVKSINKAELKGAENIFQIKERLLQLTDKRKEMIDKWEDRWEWLRLSKAYFLFTVHMKHPIKMMIKRLKGQRSVLTHHCRVLQ